MERLTNKVLNVIAKEIAAHKSKKRSSKKKSSKKTKKTENNKEFDPRPMLPRKVLQYGGFVKGRSAQITYQIRREQNYQKALEMYDNFAQEFAEREEERKIRAEERGLKFKKGYFPTFGSWLEMGQNALAKHMDLWREDAEMNALNPYGSPGTMFADAIEENKIRSVARRHQKKTNAMSAPRRSQRLSAKKNQPIEVELPPLRPFDNRRVKTAFMQFPQRGRKV